MIDDDKPMEQVLLAKRVLGGVREELDELWVSIRPMLSAEQRAQLDEHVHGVIGRTSELRMLLDDLWESEYHREDGGSDHA